MRVLCASVPLISGGVEAQGKEVALVVQRVAKPERAGLPLRPVRAARRSARRTHCSGENPKAFSRQKSEAKASLFCFSAAFHNPRQWRLGRGRGIRWFSCGRGFLAGSGILVASQPNLPAMGVRPRLSVGISSGRGKRRVPISEGDPPPDLGCGFPPVERARNCAFRVARSSRVLVKAFPPSRTFKTAR